jgi:regulator of protease activity HflC (stomatin/prohibitin superfamily)
MRVFMLFELVVVAAFLYLICNLIRYFFFKESDGANGIFGLSDSWISKDTEKKIQEKEKSNERIINSLKKEYGKKMDKKGQAAFIGISILMCFILLFFMMTFGYVNVHPTEVAVEVDKTAGKVVETPKGVGYHFFNRFTTDMVVYVVSARAFPNDSMKTDAHSNEWNMSLKTNDGQNVSVDMTVIYSLNANEVPKLHQAVGQDYENQILLPQIRSEARIAIGEYSAEEIYNGRTRDLIQKQIKDRLTESVAKYPAINIQDT